MLQPRQCVRLGCYECSRDDCDGITPEELHRLETVGGWQEVQEVQLYEDAILVYDNPADAPAGWSVLDWETHIGLCPDCQASPTDEP